MSLIFPHLTIIPQNHYNSICYKSESSEHIRKRRHQIITLERKRIIYLPFFHSRHFIIRVTTLIAIPNKTAIVPSIVCRTVTIPAPDIAANTPISGRTDNRLVMYSFMLVNVVFGTEISTKIVQLCARYIFVIRHESSDAARHTITSRVAVCSAS